MRHNLFQKNPKSLKIIFCTHNPIKLKLITVRQLESHEKLELKQRTSKLHELREYKENQKIFLTDAKALHTKLWNVAKSVLKNQREKSLQEKHKINNISFHPTKAREL